MRIDIVRLSGRVPLGALSLIAIGALLLPVPVSASPTAPQINTILPASGPLGTPVTITGRGLSSVTQVTFGGTTAAIKSKTATALETTVPAGAGTGKIKLIGPGGSAISVAAFRVSLGIRLSSAYVQPGGTLLVSGSGFSHGRAVELYLDTTLVRLVGAGASGAFVNAQLSVPKGTDPWGHWVSAVDRATASVAQQRVTAFVNWPEFRGGPVHHGRNPLESGISAGNVADLDQAWRSVGTTGFFSSAAVANGVVYIGSDDDSLYAFPAAGCGSATCGPLWTGATGGHVESSPAVASGVVFVGSFDGKLYAFKAAGCGAATCAPLWTGATGDWVWSSPVVANGVVYVGSYDGKLYAFKAAGCGAATCAPLWTAMTIGQVFSSPAVADGVVYVGSGDGGGHGLLYAYAAAGCGSPTCDPLWTAATGNTVQSSPAVANGVVYLTASDGKLYAFAAAGCGAATCTPVWTGSTGQFSNASPAVANGAVYVGSFDGKLYAFPASGCGLSMCAPLWTGTMGNFGETLLEPSPVVANGVVYSGSANNKLYAFPAAGCGSAACAPVWTATTGDVIGGSPTVANGIVYIGSEDGRLHAYDLSGDVGVNALPPAPNLSSLHRHGERSRLSAP